MNEEEAVAKVEEVFPGTETLDAQEEEFTSPELNRLFTQIERDIVNWIPQNPGDKVGGTLIDITDVDAEFVQDRDSVPMLIIESPTKRLWGVRCYATVLRNEVERRLNRGTLRIGYLIAITYKGKGGEEGRTLNQYGNYRVTAEPPKSQ